MFNVSILSDQQCKSFRKSMRACYRYIHDCDECFWVFHQGYHWEQATALSKQRRQILCQKLNLVHVSVQDEYFGGLFGVGQPEHKNRSSNLAEGGGKCWFSTI